MTDKITGSLHVLSDLQLTGMVTRLDVVGKKLLRHPEILSVILKGVVEEYRDYTLEQIAGFIDGGSVSSPEVSRGRTYSALRGEATEFVELDERTVIFDALFRAKNPDSPGGVNVNLHINVELQKDYRPGYPIEKRAAYYLARSLSSQMNLLTKDTDYGKLEKCFSIWICRDRVPKRERFTISFYGMQNYRNVGDCAPDPEDYDLFHMVIIRLGDCDCPPECDELFTFLSALFYPHKKGFRETLARFIDFDGNPELQKEVNCMTGLGLSILEEGRTEGRIEGRMEGRVEGRAEGRIEGKISGIAGEVISFLEELGQVPSAVSQKVTQERDLMILHRWVRMAARADTIDDFIRGM